VNIAAWCGRQIVPETSSGNCRYAHLRIRFTRLNTQKMATGNRSGLRLAPLAHLRDHNESQDVAVAGG
jgi:hypothetical protein